MVAADLAVRVETRDRSYDLSIGEGPVWIGRSTECAVMLPSTVVSRKHVALYREGTELMIADASHNGSLIEGNLVRQSAVKVRGGRAKIQIGPFHLEVIKASAEKVKGAPVVQQAVLPDGALEAPARPAKVPQASPDSGLASAKLRRRIHRALLDVLELPKLEGKAALEEAALRPKVGAALAQILVQYQAELPVDLDKEALIAELTDEALGLGPLERLLADESVSEVMVVDPGTIYAERRGRLELTGLKFTDDDTVRAVIERIVTPLGRRIDESNPIVDARLKDGSRVNAVIPPLAIKGPCITIRKFQKAALQMSDLVQWRALDSRMARFLERSVRIKKNIVISGGTGSGKTTLLNLLSASILPEERLVTIEDAAELKLNQPHVVSLEARPPNLEGRGEYTIRDLLKNALRMRPDRIIVGECRGGETLDMLQAMNTGHEGSMTTTHANSPREALSRLETLCLMSGVELPISAVRRQLASSLHLIVQQARLPDGSRKVVSIAEVRGTDPRGEIELFEIFGFHRTGTGEGGEVLGEHRATGYMPSYIDQFITSGLVPNGDYL